MHISVHELLHVFDKIKYVAILNEQSKLWLENERLHKLESGLVERYVTRHVQHRVVAQIGRERVNNARVVDYFDEFRRRVLEAALNKVGKNLLKNKNIQKLKSNKTK